MSESLRTTAISLKIVYSALMAGIFFFLLISIFVNMSAGAFIKDDQQFLQIFLVISVLLALSAISGGIMIARKKMQEVPPNVAPAGRLDHYRSAMIIRAAMMEGPAFFFIVGNLLFAHYPFSIGAVLCLAVMAYYFPTNSRIMQEAGVDAA